MRFDAVRYRHRADEREGIPVELKMSGVQLTAATMQMRITTRRTRAAVAPALSFLFVDTSSCGGGPGFFVRSCVMRRTLCEAGKTTANATTNVTSVNVAPMVMKRPNVVVGAKIEKFPPDMANAVAIPHTGVTIAKIVTYLVNLGNTFRMNSDLAAGERTGKVGPSIIPNIMAPPIQPIALRMWSHRSAPTTNDMANVLVFWHNNRSGLGVCEIRMSAEDLDGFRVEPNLQRWA